MYFTGGLVSTAGADPGIFGARPGIIIKKASYTKKKKRK
jgi:hypothetical protein